jgi:hypothetical protein
MEEKVEHLLCATSKEKRYVQVFIRCLGTQMNHIKTLRAYTGSASSVMRPSGDHQVSVHLPCCSGVDASPQIDTIGL